MLDLYTQQGWLSFPALRREALPFTAVWGGRGIGKTFGALRDLRLDNPAPFILLRRTQTQIDLLSNPDFSPFRAIDREVGCLTAVKPVNKYVYAFYDGTMQDDKIVPQGPPLGHAMALSTLHNVRGFNSDAEYIIYDEFIPERHERPIKNEYDALLNAYETINRNRELQGREPVKLIMLTNANQLGNPYFIGMRVIRQVRRMLDTGTEVWKDPDRGIMLVNICRSPISEAKAGTALYRMTAGSSYSQMALGNEFSGDVFCPTRRVPLVECKPLVAVGELCIYKHKSAKFYYVCDTISGSPPTFGADDADLARFRGRWPELWEAYMLRNVVFYDELCEILYRRYYGANY